MPFAPYKTTKELGIDTTRKFKVVDNTSDGGNSYVNIGDILEFSKDDAGTIIGKTTSLFNNLNTGKKDIACRWSRLEYLEKIPETKTVIWPDGGVYNPADGSITYTGLIYSGSLGFAPKPERKMFMRKLSELAATIRRAFNQDQKALWQVGYIDDCGKPTEKARIEAHQIMATEYFENHLADFVANAKEELEVVEEEKE